MTDRNTKVVQYMGKADLYRRSRGDRSRLCQDPWPERLECRRSTGGAACFPVIFHHVAGVPTYDPAGEGEGVGRWGHTHLLPALIVRRC